MKEESCEINTIIGEKKIDDKSTKNPNRDLKKSYYL